MTGSRGLGWLVVSSLSTLLFGLPGESAAQSFLVAPTFGAGTNPSGIAVGDFNLDGKPDLAVVNAGSNDISILLANTPGDFSLTATYAVGTTPFAIAAADPNGDGRPGPAVGNSP